MNDGNGSHNDATLANTVLKQLIEEGLLLCPRCTGSPLSFLRPSCLQCISCASVYPLQDGVANLFLPQPASPKPRLESLVRAIAERYAIPSDKHSSLLEMVEDSLQSLPESAIAGEITSFIGRFALVNYDAAFTLVNHYIDPKRPLPADTSITRSVRLRNDGDFPWSSFVGHPMLVSYHWLRDEGSMAIFEGQRTSFPIEIAPGREITIPLQLHTPSQPGRYILRLLPIREGLRWFEDRGHDIPVTVAEFVPLVKPSHTNEPFSEQVDTRYSLDWLSAYLQSNPLGSRPLIIEVGGGSSPETLPLLKRFGMDGARVLNCDISMGLLRLCSLHLRFTDSESSSRFAFVNADANELPVPDQSADMIVMARALHHFPDPTRLLRAAARKLKPNGLLVVLSEPVGSAYDDHTTRLLSKGVNEQVFAAEDYLTMFSRAALRPQALRLDWGFSMKAILRRHQSGPGEMGGRTVIGKAPSS